jgi:hypothetical protein
MDDIARAEDAVARVGEVVRAFDRALETGSEKATMRVAFRVLAAGLADLRRIADSLEVLAARSGVETESPPAIIHPSST